MSTAEVLRLRAASAVSRGISVRRSAQDDDSVGELTERRTFVREPGRTADPSAALGMRKGRVVTFIRGRQIRMDRKKQQVPFDFAQGRLSTSLRFGRDDNLFKT